MLSVSNESIEGSNEWTTFRRGHADYAPAEDGKPAGYKAHLRQGSGLFILGDSFNVDFDLDGFDQNDPEDQKVMNKYGLFTQPH